MKQLAYRHELKFLCSEHELQTIESKIRHVCKLDKHVENSKDYVIRSLYFDTYDNQCYDENLMGIDNRKKYRIRMYDNNAGFIKLECKYSFHGMKAKESCQITKEQCKCLMRGGDVQSVGENQELLRRFLLEKKMNILVPKIIVKYIRTPYVYEVGNVRITFDRNIQSSSHIAGFLEGAVGYRNLLPEDIHILEVKYDEVLPIAIMNLLTGGQRLRRTSFSKYALCREYSIR